MTLRKVVSTMPAPPEMEIYDIGNRHWGIRGKSETEKNKGKLLDLLTSGELVKLRSSYHAASIARELPDGNTLTMIECVDYQHGRDWNPTFYIVGLEEMFNQYDILSASLEEDAGMLEEMRADTSKFYNQFSIPKRDGSRREINAPNENMKRVQKKILRKVLYGAKASRNCHGFMNGRSIKTNAEAHVGKKVIVKMDISDFFGTINREMVLGALNQQLGNRPELLKNFGLIADLCLLNGFTPQGAPTSPTLSNIVLKELDFTLHGIARQRGAVYTRYADDLTFSSNNGDLPKLIPIITRLVSTFGFRINRKKTGVFRSGGRQPVTGITVNEVASVPRQKRMRFRAKLHHILTGKIPPSDVNMAEIKGYASFINMVNPSQGEKFLAKIVEIEEMFQGQEV